MLFLNINYNDAKENYFKDAMKGFLRDLAILIVGSIYMYIKNLLRLETGMNPLFILESGMYIVYLATFLTFFYELQWVIRIPLFNRKLYYSYSKKIEFHEEQCHETKTAQTPDCPEAP